MSQKTKFVVSDLEAYKKLEVFDNTHILIRNI